MEKYPTEYPTYVYALVDPRDNTVRYIGITQSPEKRRKEHAAGSAGCREKALWLRDLMAVKVEPGIMRLALEPTKDAARKLEGWFIRHVTEAGYSLNNRCEVRVRVEPERFMDSELIAEIEPPCLMRCECCGLPGNGLEASDFGDLCPVCLEGETAIAEMCQ